MSDSGTVAGPDWPPKRFKDAVETASSAIWLAQDMAVGYGEAMPVLTLHRFTVEDYYRMAETGVLQPDTRVELLDGEVIDAHSRP
jgi:hypothetical protein